MAHLSVQPQVIVVARLYVYIFFILTFYILISTIAYLPQRRGFFSLSVKLHFILDKISLTEASQLHHFLGATTAIPILKKEGSSVIYLQLAFKSICTN